MKATKKELRLRIEALEAEVAALKARPPLVIQSPPVYPHPYRGWWQNPVTYTVSGSLAKWDPSSARPMNAGSLS